MKKLAVIFLIPILLMIVVVLSLNPKKSNSIPSHNQALQLVVYQDLQLDAKNPEHFDKITVKPGMTALDLLKQTAQIQSKGEGVNAFIVSINNREASQAKKEFWAFYVNGKQAQVGAGSYKLKPGDKILWKIETY